MAPSASSLKRSVLFALPVLFGLPLVGGLVAFVTRGFSNRTSASATFAVFAALVLVAFLALTRRHAPRAGVVVATAAAAWAGFLAMGATTELQDAIVFEFDGLRCGNGMAMMYLFAVPVVAVITLGVGLGLGVAFARRSNDRFVRGLAFVASAVTAILLAFEVPRLGLPDPDSYLASLPLERTMNLQSGAVTGTKFKLDYVREKMPPTSNVGEEDPLGECRLTGFAEPLVVQQGVLETESCSALRILRDEPGSLLIVERDSCAAGEPCWYPVAAIRASDGVATPVYPRLIASRLAAPVGWRFGAAFGLVSACGLIALAARIRRRASAEKIEDVHHHGDGRIELDGQTFLYPGAMSLPKGPVVLFGLAEREGSYRDGGAPAFTRAEAGTSAQREEAILDIAASVTTTAMAIAMLGAAPLLVARFFGL